jgi:hypothetical protein
MTNATTWPDRDLYRVAVSNAAICFDDPNFQTAEFARTATGMPAAWNGARSIVFCATTTGRGTLAVRFALSDDPVAAQRYAALSDYLSRAPLPCLVTATWVADGIRLSGRMYPLLVMEWVDGQTLETEVDHAIGSTTARQQLGWLAREWRNTARSVAAAGIGHGDIHAGNILVDKHEPGVPRVRLIDYDNISLPGLALPSNEGGHPAFQHPRRRPDTTGPHLDALGNTLTYLSLAALAKDPRGWQLHYGGDDALLFSPADLADTTRDVWRWLAASPDATVCALTALTTRWLDGEPDQFPDLEKALAAAGTAAAGRPAQPVVNVWPPRPNPAPPAAWPPAAPAPPAVQQWPPPAAPAQKSNPPRAHGAGQPRAKTPVKAPTPTSSSDSSLGAWVIAIIVIAIIAYAIWH